MALQQDFAQIIEKCPGCKAGISWYIRIDERFTNKTSRTERRV
jgi:hypothetical protein